MIVQYQICRAISIDVNGQFCAMYEENKMTMIKLDNEMCKTE